MRWNKRPFFSSKNNDDGRSLAGSNTNLLEQNAMENPPEAKCVSDFDATDKRPIKMSDVSLTHHIKCENI